MCGITGFLNLSTRFSRDELVAWVARMAEQIRHRGPDDSGVWVDEGAGIGLGFRRLAIIDLTPTGHQPMLSADGRYVIVFNGEVYNFSALKEDLTQLGHTFRGTSDTEVMLAAVVEWGLESAVKRFNGMFAFALWDRKERCLYLVRDRLGIKPLYFGWMGSTFIFGSELKTLAVHPDFHGHVDRNALASFLRFNYVPTPYSIFKHVRKLEPGTILRVDAASGPGQFNSQVYWSAREVVENGIQEPFVGGDQEAADTLENLLRDSIRLRMIADVPLGAFLSGGVDSSTVVALMQTQSSLPVKTFTIGFEEDSFNEAVHARAVARHLGTEHTELALTPAEARAVIPLLPQIYDEPFSDSSQIPTFLVSRLARQHVTVSLSGDGGDELFAGYNRYTWVGRLWKSIGWMPMPARRAIARLIASLTPAQWERLLRFSGYSEPGEKMRKLAEALPAANPEAIYQRLASHWHEPQAVVNGGVEWSLPDLSSERWPKGADTLQRMMYFDLVSYLRDDILAKVDRASMANSLEARVPLLDDHRVVEFAWRLPTHLKIREGQSKWLLRQVLYRHVPRTLIERPKQGFGIPIDDWLRGPLRGWAEEYLSEARIRREGIFFVDPIRRKWQEHLEGRQNWQYYLWDILMFQTWYAEHKSWISP